MSVNMLRAIGFVEQMKTELYIGLNTQPTASETPRCNTVLVVSEHDEDVNLEGWLRALQGTGNTRRISTSQVNLS
jgi:hypothetical protein